MKETPETSAATKSSFHTVSLLLLFLLLGAVWLQKGPTDQELIANASKALEFHPWNSWWSPLFLGGSSQAPGLTTVVSFLILKAFIMPFGILIGPKIAGLFATILGAFGMRAFLRRWTGDDVAGWLGGMAYILGPQMGLRLAANEHLPVVFAMVFAPWILWVLLAIAREPSWKNALILALLSAGMTLAFTKLAIMFAPMAAFFVVYLLLTRRAHQKSLVVGLGRALIGYIPLAVLILLPTLREAQWLVMFKFDPFTAWQQNFSLRSVISWLDRGNVLQQGMAPGFIADQGGFYVGVVTIAVGLTAWWRADKEAEEENSATLLTALKVIFGMLLFVSWMSEGPRSIAQGMLDFLKSSAPAPDLSIPIFWVMTVVQCVLIWFLWPDFSKGASVKLGSDAGSRLLNKMVQLTRCSIHDLSKIAVILIYLFIPGFRIFELLPFAHDIRAPWSVWQVGGSLVVASLFGVGSALLLKKNRAEGGYHRILALLLLLLLAVDYLPYLRRYSSGSLPEGTYQAFEQICSKLKLQPNNGSVYPISGRYFYLQIPALTGKPIEQEAFNSYFGLTWRRAIQNATMSSAETMRAGLSLMGCSYIFIDKQDPSTPADLQKVFRGLFPTLMENDFFVILANPNVLYPAFLAHDFVTFPQGSYLPAASAALQLAIRNLVTVESVTVDQSIPGFAGMFKGQNQVDLLPQYDGKSGQPFVRVPLSAKASEDGQQMKFEVPPSISGWLVLTQSYHPDWTATIDGTTAPVHRADSALLSTFVPGGSREVVFQFTAPAWYGVCIDLGFISWIAALACLIYLPSRFAPTRVREWWSSGNC